MNRLNTIHKIRQCLASGGHSIGSWMQIPNASVAEIMGGADLDWVAVDMEHGSISHSQLPDIFRAIELGGALPLARIAEGQPRDCKQALDAGAGGVIVPMVESAEQLAFIRDACRWPPSGRRGVGFSRANMFGKAFQDYEQESQAPLLVAMIESIRAIDHLDAILTVQGLDAIFVGPYDLSASLGRTGQFSHPDFQGSMKRILGMANNAKIAVGIHVVQPSINELNRRLNEGYQFLAYSIDAVMLRSQIESIKELIKLEME